MDHEQNQRVSVRRSKSISYATGKNRVSAASNHQNNNSSSLFSPLHEEEQHQTPSIALSTPLHSNISTDSFESTVSSNQQQRFPPGDLLDSSSIPKTLQYSSTIQHLIKRYGAVSLIRQLSEDLAEREAEISLIRRRNALRENVMVKLLNEMGFSINQIELMIKERLNKSDADLQNINDNSYLKESIHDAMSDHLNPTSPTKVKESLSAKSSATSLKMDEQHNTTTPKKIQTRPHSLSSPPAPPSSTLISQASSIPSSSRSSQTTKENHNNSNNNNLLLGVVSHKFLNHMPQTFHDAIISNTTHLKKPVPVEMENFDPRNVKPPTYKEKELGGEDEDYVDQYGFLYNRNKKSLKASSSESNINITITSKLLEIAKDYDKSQQQNNKSWNDFIKKITLLNTNQGNEDELPDELLIIKGENISHYKHIYNEFVKLVSNGIPMEYRTRIWSELTGSKVLKTPNEYSTLLDDEEHNLEAESQIKLDLYRTMPFNIFFKDNGPGLQKLENVLIAISRKYPKIGYCQGMNFIVANLLLVYPVEEDAFWVFIGMLENILPIGFFNLSNIKNDMMILKKTFKEELPKLYDHFKDIGVELDPICFNWIVSLFSDSLPVYLILRIWDNLMLNGYKEIFKISLAIFKIFEKQLLLMNDNIEIYEFMKNLQKVNFNLKSSDLIRLSSTFNVNA